MRHVHVSRATYTLAALLILSVLGFGWFRSQGIILTTQQTIRAETTTESHPWLEQGSVLYSESCAGCHEQVTYIPELFLAEGGRDYLVTLMLYGYNGPITVAGEEQSLRHPPFARFDDDTLAALLNTMLVSWGNDEALPEEVDFFAADEFAEARGQDLEREEVVPLRPRLE